MSLIDELRRRNVIRVAIGYLAAAWLLIQIGETFWEIYELPGEILQGIVAVLVIGFIPAVVSAWVFEWTPDGLVRDRGSATGSGQNKRFDRVVMAVLALAVAFLLVDKFVLTERAPADDDKSIAVLVFEDMSADGSQEYFSDGITEEMLNLLAQNSALQVTSRSSVDAIKGRELSIPAIAELLGVRYVLEGSVRRAGDTVRITAQLIDGSTDRHVWSESYDREFRLGDVLIIQHEIAAKVVDALNTTLFDHDVQQVNAVAYDAELQARYLLNLYNPDNFARISEIIDKGLEADPEHAPLWWLKYRLVSHRQIFNVITEKEEAAEKQVIEAVLRRIDPDSAYWLLMDAGEAYRNGDLRSTARYVAQAFERAPADLQLVENVLRYARRLGQYDVSEALGKYLVANDPLCGRCYFRIGVGYIEAFEFEKARDALLTAEDLGMASEPINSALGSAYLHLGEPREALERFRQLRPGADRTADMIRAYFDLGMTAEYEELDAELEQYGDSHARGIVDAWVGNNDAAFAHIEDDLVQYPVRSLELFQSASFIRIMDDPRWAALMQRLGTTPEDVASWTIDIDVPEVD